MKPRASPGTEAPGDTTAPTEPSGAGSEAAQARVDAFRQPVTELPLSEPISVEPGTKLFYVQCSVPVCAEIAVGIEAAADAAGWEYQTASHQDTPDTVASAFDAAIAAQPDVVLTSGNPREWFEPQLATHHSNRVVADQIVIGPLRARLVLLDLMIKRAAVHAEREHEPARLRHERVSLEPNPLRVCRPHVLERRDGSAAQPGREIHGPHSLLARGQPHAQIGAARSHSRRSAFIPSLGSMRANKSPPGRNQFREPRRGEYGASAIAASAGTRGACRTPRRARRSIRGG